MPAQTDGSLTAREKYFPAVLATSLIFQSASADIGYGAIGGYANDEQEEIMNVVIQQWITLPSFLPTLRHWHPSIDAKTVCPFVGASAGPNIFSVIHLIAQSIVSEHVWSANFSLLIAQVDMTYELFEGVLSLPDGFLTAFQGEKAKDGVTEWMMSYLGGFLPGLGNKK